MVRRLVPWALLGLLTVGAAAGIALGVANQPGQTPAQWVASALATTARTGSARFTYSDSDSSSIAELRSQVRGYGVVDFKRGDLRDTEVNRQLNDGGGANADQHARSSLDTTETIGIGHTLYEDIGAPLDIHWMKLPLPREPQSNLGFGAALNGNVALSGLEGVDPVVTVRAAGPATVGGVATIKYLVSTAAPVLCPGQHKTTGLTFEQLPTTVWIDHAGRIVQVRSEFREEFGPPPAGIGAPFSHIPTGSVHSVATLRFSDFGLPLTIAAPSIGPNLGQSASFGIATSRRCGSS